MKERPKTAALCQPRGPHPDEGRSWRLLGRRRAGRGGGGRRRGWEVERERMKKKKKRRRKGGRAGDNY